MPKATRKPGAAVRQATVSATKSARLAARDREPGRTWLRRPIRINKDDLDAAAGVRFSWSDVAYFVGLCTDYRERFRGPVSDFSLTVAQQPPEAAELEARRAFVDAVECVWCECRRRRGRGSFYSRHAGYDGPLVRLLLKLFKAMGEPNPPSAATLHHDLTFVQGGGERDRGAERPR
jgi:hypothetical protein